MYYRASFGLIDKIHIYNPGFLTEGKRPLDFANGSNGPIARNPLINTVLYLNKTIESFGAGFGRVFNLCKKENIKVKFGNNSYGFVFEFLRKNNVTTNVTTNVTINLTNTELQVYNVLKIKPKSNRLAISKEIRKTEMTVQRAIKKLIQEKYIKRVGSNKTGFWEVIK